VLINGPSKAMAIARAGAGIARGKAACRPSALLRYCAPEPNNASIPNEFLESRLAPCGKSQ